VPSSSPVPPVPPQPPGRAEREFARRVCVAFGLNPTGIRIRPMPASSIRLWQLEVPNCPDLAGGRFVVKEFPYHDGDRPTEVAAAAEFEYGLWRDGDILMPEPLRARDGELVLRLAGSRAATVPVRLHRWLDGEPPPMPSPVAIAAAAGRVLAVIHRAGSLLPARPAGNVRWWTSEPRELAGPLAAGGLLTATQAAMASTSLDRADAVLSAGNRLPGNWIYTHCDHKPGNSLLVGGRIAVLDWDECGYCHPRLEAVESALRWAAAEHGELETGVARAFLSGYGEMAGTSFGRLTVGDFAKWVAAQAGWFWFTGRRALGCHDDDTDADRIAAAEMAADAIETLDRALASLDRWAELLSGA
jgi:hypothetical protein